MEYVVYKISNIINKRVYVGSTKNFLKRKNGHLYHLRAKSHHSVVLQYHVNKYGIDTLYFEIIEIVENESDLMSREQYYIDRLNTKFNVLKYAGRTTGYKHTSETLMKISKSNSGKSPSAEVRLKMSECRIGSKHPNYGKPMSDEQKVLISITKTKDRHTNINHSRMILNTETGVFSYGWKDAEFMYNIKSNILCNRLLGFSNNRTSLKLC